MPPGDGAGDGGRALVSPYLTVDEAAVYCRCKRRTLLNRHSLGRVRSVPGSHPPLFQREDLDAWLNAGPKERKK
jgi:excisionase family DNA binding protein